MHEQILGQQAGELEIHGEPFGTKPLLGVLVGKGAEGLEVARVVFQAVEPRQSARGPAGFELVEVAAGLAHAVEDGVDAVLALVADMPDRDWRCGS